MSTAALARLLQLASPTLPVGAYSYSQGLESATELGTVCDRASAQRWIGDLLTYNVSRMEAPLLCRLVRAWDAGQVEEVARWNAYFLATRETAELRAETLQMGYSLVRLFSDLEEFDGADLAILSGIAEISFPAAYAFAVSRWQVAPHDALVAYLWSWLENQVMAAVKAVPLGQTDGQRMLARLGAGLDGLAAASLAAEDPELRNFAPALAIASSRHETQYSRLFRS